MRSIINLFTLLVLASPVFSQAQKRGMCMYAQSDRSAEICQHMQQNSFQTNAAAKAAIDQLLRPIGLKSNFITVPCGEIRNCAAIVWDDGMRYIVYDKDFMKTISDAAGNRGVSGNWTSISIFAHELGHHLNGHTLMRVTLSEQREEELEADEFSGFLMAKLNATLDQAQAAMKTVAHPSCAEAINSDHPCLEKRLEYIQKGWLYGKGNQIQSGFTGLYSARSSGASVEFGGDKLGIRYCFYSGTYENLTLHINFSNNTASFTGTYKEAGLYNCVLPAAGTLLAAGQSKYFSIDTLTRKVDILFSLNFPLANAASFQGYMDANGIIEGNLKIERETVHSFRGYSLSVPLIVRSE